MTIGPVNISGGFILLAALVYLFDESGFAPLLVLAATAHELGHFCAIRALGGRVRRLRMGLVGLTMEYDGRNLGYGGEIVIALAGPALSFLLAYGASLAGRYMGGDWAFSLGGISLILGVFNLLPVYQLDGGRALYMLLAWIGGPDWAGRVSCLVSCAAILCLLVAGGGLLIWSRWNFTLLTAAVWMLIGYCKSGGNTVKYLALP